MRAVSDMKPQLVDVLQLCAEDQTCMQCLVTKRRLTRMECAAIALVVAGVVMATVTDSTVMTNMLGCVLSGAAILFSAVYQVGCLQEQLTAQKQSQSWKGRHASNMIVPDLWCISGRNLGTTS